MKKIALLILLIIVIFVLLRLNVRKEDYLVKINNYTISMQEFNEEFMDSAYAKDNTMESKKEFLKLLIRRKLVLQDAQARGLDKDKEFLKSVERFWEQSLLKRAMEEKSREVSGSTNVSDKTVEAVYNKIKSDGKAAKPYDQMYDQIKWSLLKFQESRAMNNWLAGLYKKSKIVVNPKYASKKPENNAKVANPAKDIKAPEGVKDAKILAK